MNQTLTCLRKGQQCSSFSSIEDMTGDPKGVAKLLDELNIHKAPGPDDLNATRLNVCSNEGTYIFIFNEVLARGEATSNCFKFFKKMKRYDDANYRLVSHTCIRCKPHPRASSCKQHQQTAFLLTVNVVFQVSGLARPSWSSLCTISPSGWTQTDSFDHNGFSLYQVITKARVLWQTAMSCIGTYIYFSTACLARRPH